VWTAQVFTCNADVHVVVSIDQCKDITDCRDTDIRFFREKFVVDTSLIMISGPSRIRKGLG
jgi:hypothetical protein